MNYEQIVFMQNDYDAAEPLKIYDRKGARAAVNYLAQWHNPGEHDTRNEPGAGRSDTVHRFKDGYVLTVNNGLGYIGLEYIVQE